LLETQKKVSLIFSKLKFHILKGNQDL